MIANRAETIATERMLFAIQEKLSISEAALEDRIDGMKKLWRDMQRGELMRMRRSALNLNLFPKARYHTLYDSFSSWVRFYFWNKGNKDAFLMKYEIIKRRIDLDRQFKDQLQGMPSKKISDNKGNMAKSRYEIGGLSTIQKHNERVVQCKKCRLFYLDAQNTAISCEYHSGKFQLECPRTCPNPGLTRECNAHRRRRWTCCDGTKENLPGCSRMYHVAVDRDPTYERVMDRINERDEELVQNVEERADNAAQMNWPRKAYEANRVQIVELEEDLEKGRDAAGRYKDIKWQ